MFYDPRLGEAITLTGQYIILKIKEGCNQKLSDLFKTSDYKYSVYLDTDSYFFTIENIVKKYWAGKTNNEITDALDKLFESKIRPLVEQVTDEIALIQNHYKKTILFKRENICSGGFWIGKKRYALKVYNSEGVSYPDGDYKIMGIEVVRSSTPQLARDLLKKCVVHVIDRDITALRTVVEETRNIFKTAPLESIAFPRGANNLAEYSSVDTIYSKGSPIAVRGALLYNHHLKLLKLDSNYDYINEGDKLKFIYLKEPNKIRENVIAFSSELPTEFGLHDFIDRDTQFEKVFMAPLENIMKAVGWTLEEVSDLESFFG